MPKVVYYIENDENTLSHYGRLGMKWGQHVFGNDSIYRRVKASNYRRSSFSPSGRSRAIFKLTNAQMASIRRHDYLYSSKNIDLGKSFVKSIDYSTLLDDNALERRVRMARHMLRNSGW